MVLYPCLPHPSYINRKDYILVHWVTAIMFFNTVDGEQVLMLIFPLNAVDVHSPFFHLQTLGFAVSGPRAAAAWFLPSILPCALSLCFSFPIAGRCKASSKHRAGLQQCLVSRRKLPNVPTCSSDIFQKSFPSLTPQLHGMESVLRNGELANHAYRAWTQHGAVSTQPMSGCDTRPPSVSPHRLCGSDIGKQMFLSWKSCSWILDCVYIPSRYAMWKCLEIGNGVPAEWVKGMRLKKSHYHHFREACQIPRFCAWFAHPADVSAQISLLVFSSYAVCQAQMRIHLSGELVQISDIPTVSVRAWGRDVTARTHTCPLTAWWWISTPWVVFIFLGNHKWFSARDSRGLASEKQYMTSPDECCYCSL